jgi:hypothetical protein
MKTNRARPIALALAAFIWPIAIAIPAFGASDPEVRDQKMWLACENGKNYPIRPIAVSREYDLVTGYLVNIGRRHSVHLRLVPMGVGYRYAGPGIWFDGLRGEAVLNWGRSNAVPCTVEQE